jgi:hypothetical protein
VVVVDTKDGHVVIDHMVPDFADGWATHGAFITGPWLIVTEANTLHSSDVRAYRYDLRSGTQIDLNGKGSLPAPGDIWSVSDGLATFATNDVDRLVSCLIVFDVASLEWRERWCDPQEQFVDWVRLGPGGTITFRLQESSVPEREPCARLFQLQEAGSDTPTELPLQETCKGFSGAGGPDWAGWSEVGLRSPSIARSHGYAQRPDKRIVGLGDLQTGSLSACGDWLYWQVEVPASSSVQLRRWHPGSDGEIVFETPPDSLLGRQECSGRWLTVVVAEQGATETTYSALAP